MTIQELVEEYSTFDEFDQCGSPIEKLFIATWLAYLEFNHIPCSGSSWRIPRQRDYRMFLEAPETQDKSWLHVDRFDAVFFQQKIADYRVDFVLVRVAAKRRMPPDPAFPTQMIRLPMIVVECDGHDYHERTKEQAARDKSRDRALTTLGFRVLRFTGSEIYRDAVKCATEVDALFNAMLNPPSLSSDLKGGAACPT